MVANLVDRASAFYYVSVFVFQAYIMCLLQFILHRPAPFWVSENIQTYSCHPGFSAPTGETCVGTVMVFTIWQRLALGPEASCRGVIAKVVSFMFCSAIVFLASYGHLFNGDTSLD